MNEKNVMNKRVSMRTFGFTLVELIVVLVILSVLSAVAVPSVLGYIDDSKAKECRTQVEALAADVSSAKMAFEMSGEANSEKKFDKAQVDAYIEEAGDAGCCPVSGDKYVYDEANNIIKCPKEHGEGTISGSGKFTVAVVEETEKRESPDEVLPPKDDEDDKKESDANKTVPSVSLEVTPGNIDDLGKGESRDLTTKVTPQGFEGKDNVEYKYEWKSSDPSVTVTPKEDGSTATVTGELAGRSSTVTCTVTVTYTENGETKTVEDSVDVPVKVADPEPEPSVRVEVTPGSIDDLGEGESRELTAEVTPEGLDGKDNVEYHYRWESSDPSVTVTQTDGPTATVTGGTAGGSSKVTCTVTVTYTENGETKTVEDSVDVPVEVTDPKPAPSVSLEVTPGNIDDLGKGESRDLTTKVTPQGFEGKDNVEYKYEWKSSDPSVTVTPKGDGSTATVTGELAGRSSTVTCTVTVSYIEDGETKTVEDSQDISVTVTDSAADQKDGSRLDLEVTPSSATITVGQTTGFLAKPTAFGCTVTGFQWSAKSPENAEITGESNKYTVRVAGKKVGKCVVECTVTAQTNDEQHKTLTKTASAIVSVEESGMFKDLPTPFLVDRTQGQRNVVNYLKDEYKDQSKGRWEFSDPRITFNNNQDIDINAIPREELPLPFDMTYVWNNGEKSETIPCKAIIAATGMQPLVVQKADASDFPNGTIRKGDAGRVKCNGLQEPDSTDRDYLTFANWTPEIIEISDIKWEPGGTIPYVEFTALGVGKAKIVATVYREFYADFLTQEIEFEIKPLVPTQVHFTPNPVNLSVDEEQTIELVIDEPAGATVDGITSIQWEYDNNFVEIRESGEKYKYIMKGKQIGFRQIKARLNRDGMQQLEVMIDVNIQ